MRKSRNIYALIITYYPDKSVLKDNNGKFWMVGNDRGAVATSSTAESGTAFGDRNGFSIELTGLAPDAMYEVTVAES